MANPTEKLDIMHPIAKANLEITTLIEDFRGSFCGFNDTEKSIIFITTNEDWLNR